MGFQKEAKGFLALKQQALVPSFLPTPLDRFGYYWLIWFNFVKLNLR